jgi:hypothetical protein
MHYNKFHYERSMASIGANGQAMTVNYETMLLKQWFANEMRNCVASLGGYIDGKPVSPEFETLFIDKYNELSKEVIPSPDSTSWMQLFEIYQLLRAQAIQRIKGLLVPELNILIEEVIKNSSWNPKFEIWYKMPLNYLTSIESHAHMDELDRNPRNGQPGTGFIIQGGTGKGKSKLKLGYRELFTVPKFGEIYCETYNKDSLTLNDRLIAIESAHDIRYYAIMMCKKLPVEIFDTSNQRKR